jgi:hypothetical protein
MYPPKSERDVVVVQLQVHIMELSIRVLHNPAPWSAPDQHAGISKRIENIFPLKAGIE